MEPITVGFDLDMTLIDSRPGIAAVYAALAEETGVAIDTAAIVSRLGPPIAVEMANWFPPERIDALVDRYRQHYPQLAVRAAPLLPGAAEALAAIRAHGGRVVVVTGKYGPSAQLHLDHLGIEVDGLAGELWAEEKAVALREFGATVYVGDHVSDLRAAAAAGAYGVGVASGPITADELRAGGADVVLDDLAAFPGWFDGYVRQANGSRKPPCPSDISSA